MKHDQIFAYKPRPKQEIFIGLFLIAAAFVLMATAKEEANFSSRGVSLSAEQNYVFQLFVSFLLGVIGLFALFSWWKNRTASKTVMITQMAVQVPEQGMMNKTRRIKLADIEGVEMRRSNSVSEVALFIKSQDKTIKVFRNRLQNSDDLAAMHKYLVSTFPVEVGP